MTDEGVEYDALGNATKLPAVDAGGQELGSSYYVDGQVATQEQNKTLDSYVYDPAGRTMEATAEDTETKAGRRIVSHYAGPGEAVTWTSEGTEKSSRNIPGIGGPPYVLPPELTFENCYTYQRYKKMTESCLKLIPLLEKSPMTLSPRQAYEAARWWAAPQATRQNLSSSLPC